VLEGFGEDLFDGAGEFGDLVGFEFVGVGEGMDLCGVEGLVYVDVAEAGDESLVEEGVFDGAFGAGQTLCEFSGAECERFGADVLIAGFAAEPEDAAEASGVFKAELSSLRGMGDSPMRSF
jgi:hypothetical protein